jgi:hypothetical protein
MIEQVDRIGQLAVLLAEAEGTDDRRAVEVASAPVDPVQFPVTKLPTQW